MKVLTSNVGGAAGRSVSLIYQLDGDKLITVSGMLTNETSLPETRLIEWERKTESPAK